MQRDDASKARNAACEGAEVMVVTDKLDIDRQLEEKITLRLILQLQTLEPQAAAEPYVCNIVDKSRQLRRGP